MKRTPFSLAIRGLITVYLVLFVLGWILFLLPGMCKSPLSGLDALFMSISALTLTGLQTIDFAANFTPQGQAATLILIELGALSAISFSLYAAWLAGRAFLFTNEDSLLNDSANTWHAFKKILLKTAGFVLFFEAVSTIIIFAFWTGDIPFSPAEKLGYAVFHGISVFCHAGFSNLGGNFSNPHVHHSYVLLLALTGVMVLGSVGYAAIFDLISIKRLRERMAEPGKNWMLQTRIALFGTLILMVIGSVYWFVAERNNALLGEKPVEAAFTSIFNTAGARGAGFYSVSVNQLTHSMALFYTFLMLIGVSASSAGGGIKTSIIGLFFMKKDKSVILKLRLFLYFVAGVLILSMILFLGAEPHITRSAARLEILSAFTNTGLSSGVTAGLSPFGKSIIMADMILGRVGLLVAGLMVLKGSDRISKEMLMV